MIYLLFVFSNEESQDISLDVVTTVLVLNNIEGLGESEFISVIHLESTEDKHRVLTRSFEDIQIINLVNDLFITEGFNVLANRLEAVTFSTVVIHLRISTVEVSQSTSFLFALHHSTVVFSTESLTKLLLVHFYCLIDILALYLFFLFSFLIVYLIIIFI